MKNSESIPDEEANKMLNEILKEDEGENTDETESCSADCAEEDPAKKVCECSRIAEYSSRFSLRVMEAMRSLQQDKDEPLPTSTAEDIVEYIEANYRDDGDLYAQVRTALKQVCSQGLVMQLLENKYHFIGPDAISMNQATCSKDRGDCLLASSPKAPAKRRKRNKVEKGHCGCGTSTTEELESETKRGKFSNKNQSSKETPDDDDPITILDGEDEEDNAAGDVPQCSCTDEDISAEQNGDAEDRERTYLQANPSERKRTALDQDILNTMDISHTTDEHHRESQAQIVSKTSKQREKELARWIKRCQEECERRRKQN